MFLSPPDDAEATYEFYAPFAHIPGRFEWCRIRSPTHGVFDVFIVLGKTTAVPATVYAADDAGESFMRERYPESTCIRADSLDLEESHDGRTVHGRMAASSGPVREADFALVGTDGTPQQVPYGGTGAAVWGSERFTCWGVDLNVPATAQGHVTTTEGREDLDGVPGIVALGSFGRIAPRAADQ